MLAGILVVDKPAGPTSHDVVACVRRVLGERRVGHAGTLDPAATGVLPLLIGPATRLAEYLLELPKSYDVTCRLGEETDTDDAQGRVVAGRPAAHLDPSEVRDRLLSMQGVLEQVPPAYSALKQGGERLYVLARRGREVEPRPRPVEVYEISGIRVELPEVRFSVTCSRGTYVRSLCRDLGRSLGVGGHLAALRRTVCASFGLDQAHPLEAVAAWGRDEARRRLLPMDRAVAHLPAVRVGPAGRARICRGASPEPGEILDPVPAAAAVRVYDADGLLLAVAAGEAAPGGGIRLRPRKVLCAAPGK